MLSCLWTYRWALSSGVLLAWALPSFHWFPLAWVGLVPLLVNTRALNARVSAARFFVAGWIFHTIVLQWLVANIFWAGGWAILGQQGVCLALSCYWAVMGYLWARLNQHGPTWSRAVVFSIWWMSMEWLQARLFTGFGWASLGYSQGPDLWFSQVASVGGVVLISGILVAVNVLLSQLFGRDGGRLKWGVAALSLVLLSHGVGALLLDTPPVPEKEPFKVGLYQSNYPQHMKWDPAFQETMLDMAIEQSTSLSQIQAVDLFVWPEALSMRDIRTSRILNSVQSFVKETDTPLFTGTVRRDAPSNTVYNATALIETDGSVAFYDKMKLAPFGEYIPFESYLSFARGLGAGGGIAPGDAARVFSVGDREFGPLICFEVLFAPLADNRRQLGADFLVVVTNLGWFGGSNVLSQELEIARFRAIENRMPLVQCANTGVSGVIDPYGRIAVIDGFIAANGRYVTWKNQEPDRGAAMVQRRLAGMAVPEAVPMLLPGSVGWFGRLVTLVGVVIGLLYLKRSGTRPTQDVA